MNIKIKDELNITGRGHVLLIRLKENNLTHDDIREGMEVTPEDGKTYIVTGVERARGLQLMDNVGLIVREKK